MMIIYLIISGAGISWLEGKWRLIFLRLSFPLLIQLVLPTRNIYGTVVIRSNLFLNEITVKKDKNDFRPMCRPIFGMETLMSMQSAGWNMPPNVSLKKVIFQWPATE